MITDPGQIAAEKCTKEIAAILDKYNCVLIPEVAILGAEIKSRVVVLPKPKQASIIRTN